MPNTGGNILIVEDDPALRWALGDSLRAMDFEIQSCADGEQALLEMAIHQFDAVVLDINMPGMGGVETCRRMRNKTPLIPILMLSVLDKECNKLAAFDAGADDYITKPFSVPDLAARLKAAVRRFRTCQEMPVGRATCVRPIVIGEIELEPGLRTVRKGGSLLRLTPKEFELLHYLMSHAGRPIAHATLLQAVWGADAALQTAYLHTFMHNLRKKLEDQPAAPKYLLTELNFGYSFRDDAGAAHNRLSLSVS